MTRARARLTIIAGQVYVELKLQGHQPAAYPLGSRGDDAMNFLSDLEDLLKQADPELGQLANIERKPR